MGVRFVMVSLILAALSWSNWLPVFQSLVEFSWNYCRLRDAAFRYGPRHQSVIAVEISGFSIVLACRLLKLPNLKWSSSFLMSDTID